MNELQKIGSGFTAEVFLTADGKALKLFYAQYAKNAVMYEAHIAEEIQRCGLPSPVVHGVRTVGNRYGIEYEYIQGRSLFDELLAAKDKKRIIREIAQMQLRISHKTSVTLPPQHERFAQQIAFTSLDEKTKERIIGWLRGIPEENCVCHGDFHAGNLMRTEHGLVALDWMNCYRGNWESDVARSILMLASPYIPLALNAAQRFAFRSMKRRLARAYKREVCKMQRIKHYKAWLAIAAAVRLRDAVPSEEAWLTRIIRTHIRHLK